MRRMCSENLGSMASNRIRMPLDGNASTTRANALYAAPPNLNLSSMIVPGDRATTAAVEMKHPESLILRISPRKSWHGPVETPSAKPVQTILMLRRRSLVDRRSFDRAAGLSSGESSIPMRGEFSDKLNRRS